MTNERITQAKTETDRTLASVKKYLETTPSPRIEIYGSNWLVPDIGTSSGFAYPRPPGRVQKFLTWLSNLFG